MYWIRGRHGDVTPARSTYSPFVNLLKRKMSKFQFPTFSSMHCKTGKVRVSCLEFDSVPLGSCCVAGGVGGGWGSYSGLSSVVFIQDVEGDLLGETPQQTRRVQVPLEAEQPVDTSFRSGAAIRGPTPEPCCAGRRGGGRIGHDITKSARTFAFTERRLRNVCWDPTGRRTNCRALCQRL